MRNLRLAIGMALALACCSMLCADTASGTLFFTTFAGGENVHSVTYNFDGTTFTLGSVNNIAATFGADGLLVAPDGNLIVAGQNSGQLHEITTGGAAVKTVNAGDGSFHLALSSNLPNALLYSMANGGSPHIAATQLSGGGLSGDGTPYTLSCATGHAGCSTDVRGIVLDPVNDTWYYGTAGDGGSGDFGTVVFDDTAHTATLTPILFGVFAHGLTFDPFTDDIFFSSANVISQFDPTSNSIVGNVFGTGPFDQSSADGKGHLFVASNGGGLEFIDYSGSGHIVGSFATEPFLAEALDDIAPKSGIGGGSTGGSVPEPSSILLLGTALGGLIAYRARRRASQA